MQVKIGILCGVFLGLQLFAADQPPKKNIIFDIGNVIFVNKYHAIKNTLEQQAIFKAIRVSEERALWFKGQITAQELIERLSGRFVKSYVELAVEKVLASRDLIPETVSVIEQLKARGYKLYILSNTSREVFDKFIVNNPFFSQFDGMFFSFDAGSLKPEHKIYEQLLEKYRLDPKESVFIDDKPKNVAAACELGTMGFVFKPDTISAELGDCGIL